MCFDRECTFRSSDLTLQSDKGREMISGPSVTAFSIPMSSSETWLQPISTTQCGLEIFSDHARFGDLPKNTIVYLHFEIQQTLLHAKVLLTKQM